MTRDDLVVLVEKAVLVFEGEQIAGRYVRYRTLPENAFHPGLVVGGFDVDLGPWVHPDRRLCCATFAVDLGEVLRAFFLADLISKRSRCAFEELRRFVEKVEKAKDSQEAMPTHVSR